MKMDAKEFLNELALMYGHKRYHYLTIYDKMRCKLIFPADFDLLIEAAEKHARERKTIFVADEMTNVYTFEVTYVDSAGATERTEEEKRLQMEHLEHLLKESGYFPNADDIKCVGMQQFMTKKHEEEKA